jgi:hypothetical protein
MPTPFDRWSIDDNGTRFRHRVDDIMRHRELGIAFRAVSETLRDTVAWLRSQGMIPA